MENNETECKIEFNSKKYLYAKKSYELKQNVKEYSKPFDDVGHKRAVLSAILLNKICHMEQTQNTPQKVNKGLIFSAQLNWLEKRKGKLYAEDVDNSLVVATPAAFGGEGREWSPEHLFLGSLNSCFMSTYLVLADKFQFPVSKLECNSCGLVEFVDGAYRFTSIEISAKIYVEEKWEEKAKVALQKTPKYCLISNSIKSKITHSGEVVVY